MKKVNILFFVVMLSVTALAQMDKSLFTIKYLSAENVYIDGGKDDGIKVSDSLLVQRNGEFIAVLQVNYIADHSAACRILAQQTNLNPGDTVKPVRIHLPPREITATENRTRAAPQTRVTSPKTSADKMFLSGSISANWYHFTDLSTAHYNFDQPGMRINVRVRNILSKNYNFCFVTRGRYNMRSTRISSHLPEREWHNRIYQISFSYDDESAMFNYKIGRIISNTFSGVGYIDGLLLQQNVSSSFRYGLFAGTQPEWQYSTFQTSLQKYGAYLNFSHGDFQRGRYDGTLALAGEYHGATISREFVYLQNSYSNNRFNIYQSADIDINRDWRKERTGESVSLTNLYVYSNYKVTSDFSLGLSYDNRKNYYTYEIRSIADSLFDESMRYGLRGNVRLKLPGQLHIFGNIGLRTLETDQKKALSYAVGLNKYDLTSLRLFVGLYASAFSNHYSDGYHASIRCGKNFRAGHDMEMAFGTYAYKLTAMNDSRQNQWVRFNFTLQLPKSFYMLEQYEYSWGNEASGHRFYTQFGYRF